jgi:preprotein translocase subunit SecE
MKKNIENKKEISVVKFLKEAKAEIKKISWLRRKEVQIYAIIVIVVSFIVGIFLGLLDGIFFFILGRFL